MNHRDRHREGQRQETDRETDKQTEEETETQSVRERHVDSSCYDSKLRFIFAVIRLQLDGCGFKASSCPTLEHRLIL